MNRIITQFPANSARPVKKARNGATNIIVDTDGSLMVQTYDGATTPVVVSSTYAVYTQKVHVTSAQIKALNSTPIELVSNPGSGQIIVPVDVFSYLHNATTAYTSSDLYVIFDTLSTPVYTFGITDSVTVAGAMRKANVFSATTGQTNIVSNQPLNLWCTGTPTLGDGSLDIWVTYKVVGL